MKPKPLVHIISSLKRGGAENLLVALTKSLVEFEHHVFYIHDGPLRQELERVAIKTYPIGGLFCPYDGLALYRLFREIKQLDPCCIFTSLWAANILGYALCFFTKIPVISAVHALVEHEGALRTFIERCVPFSPTRYVAVGNQVAQSLIQRRRIRPSRITTIYNGIDTHALIAHDKRGVKKHGEFIFGSVGRLVPVKNYALLLESFADLAKQQSNVRLMLVGDGHQEQYLRLRAQALMIADKVTFITGQKALPYYAQFDCFVQPSRYEGISLALLEALFFELPVIVTSHDQHEVVAHKNNGLVIPPDDRGALTHAMVTMLCEGSLRDYLKKHARETVMNTFTIEQTADKYRTLIHSLI